MIQPKVTLLSHTNLPLETVYSLWEASKNEAPLMTPQDVRDRVHPDAIRERFQAVIDQHIPVGESINFVFMIEGISVSWREQAVRHRIGVKPSPERLGADIGMVDVTTTPNLADSVFWSQSMRIQDMGRFFTTGGYRTPPALLESKNEQLLEQYQATLEHVQETYNDLVAAGIPMEDARELIPLGATHRISWTLNISSLQHIVSKRGCWILQLGIWGPVIEGMISELTTKVDPVFGELVTPPCLKGDEFKGCIYHEENRRRYTGEDCHAPCPLHFRHHYLPESGAKSAIIANASAPDVLEHYKVPRAAEMVERAEAYRVFWGRDPWKGNRLRVIA